MHASMNRSFKVVFNVALGAYVAVSEITRGRGKSTKSVVAMAVAVLLSGGAYAGPLGGNVVGGQATIQNSGALTTINQATNRAIINWNGFNVNKNETVQFNHPNINAVTLNRVLSASPSLIDGAIKANGNVFIVNAAGIVVGKNANINVGGLTLSTLGISNEDFMAGRDKFVNSTGTNAQVLNQGNIEVAQGGFVAMIGGQVNNSGVIVAKEGMVALASGNAVTLTIGDGPTAHSIVVEQGTVDALVEAGGAIRVDGGQIVLAARSVNGLLKNIINQTGVLEASSLTRKGGKIILDGGDQGIVNIAGTIKADGQTGGAVVATGRDILVTGQISATGKSDGGQVNIGGGFQGQDPKIAHATNVAMTKSASIDVSSTDNGNGGTAVLWSDGTTDFHGDIKAKAGVNGGNGGLIETSGHNLGFNGTVDVNAPKGKSGDILLDPDIIVITSAATGAQDATLPTITSAATDTKGTKSTISVNAIEAITSGTVTLQANGHIQVQDLSLNGGDGEINMKPNVSLNLSTLSNTGSYTGLPSLPTYGGIEFTNSANGITATGTGALTLSAGNFAAPQAAAVSANAQAINIGHIQTESGAITLRGADGLQVKGNLTTGSGAIFLDGDADQGGVGFLNVTSNFKTNSGLVTLKGGQDSSSGVNIIGNVDVGSGGLTFANTGTTFAGTYRIAGNISALNNFTIAQPVTLGGTATIKTTGQLGFGGIVTVEANSNLTLTATSYSIANAINGNGSSITLKPANVTDDLQLGTGGTGTNVAPVLTKLNNFGNVTIGGNDLQGKVTVSGTNNIVGKLTIAAGGQGGSVVMQDGTNLTTNKDIIVTANKSITAEGTASLTSTGGKVSLVTPGDLTLTAGSKLKATTFVEIATDGKFTNPAGLGLIDPATPYWRLYVPNADSLVGTGFSASTGFHRYGCTLAAGCAATTSVPGTGSGILFKDVPLLDINAVSGSFIYGNALTTFGTTVNYAGLINGDTIADAGVTGTAGNAAYSSTPTFSGGGWANVGTYGINATTGSLLSSMGYKFKEVANSGTATVTKRDTNAVVSVNAKTYDGTTSASTGLATLGSWMTGDNVGLAVNSLNFVDKNAGTAKAVSGTASLTGSDAGNYNLTNPAIATTANISKKNVTASFNAYGKEYDGNTSSGAANLAVNGLAVPDTINNTVTYSLNNIQYADKNAGVNKTVTGTFVLGGVDAANYNVMNSNLTSTATITKKTLTAVANANTKTYDATTSATLLNSNLFGVITNDAVGYNVTGLAYVDKNAGTAKAVTGTVNLTGVDAANYTVGASTGAGNINRKELTTSLTANNKTYDGTTAATVNGSYGAGVIAGDAASASITSMNFNDKNAGNNKTVTTNFNITGADGGNYFIGNTSNQLFSTANIIPKSISSNIVAADKTYDTTRDATITSGNLVGVLAGDASTVNLNVGSALFSDKNAAAGKTVTATSTITGANAGNYTLSNPTTTTTANINKKDVTSVIVANDKIYDGGLGVPISSVTLNGVLASDASRVILGISNPNFTDKNVGVGKTVTATSNITGAEAGNYNLVNPTTTTSANITKRNVNASVIGGNKTYDGTTALGLYSINGSGLITGDAVSLTSSDIAFVDKNAGTKSYSGTAVLNGNDAGNYNLGSATVTGSATITKRALTANFGVASKVYDATTNATVSASGLANVATVDNGNVTLNVTNAQFADKNAGTNKTVTANYTLSGSEAGNYTISTNGSTTGVITRKDVTSTFQANTKTYDGNTNATLASSNVSGLITNDVVTSNVSGIAFADKNAGVNKTVNGTTTLGGADAGNYNIASTVGTGNIERKVLTGNAVISDKVYDGTTNAQWNSISITGGIVTGDAVNLDGGSNIVSQFADKNAGTNKAATVSIGLRGADAGNYFIGNTSNQISTSANITPKAITSTIVAANKVYDGNTAAAINISKLNDVIGADVVNLTVNSANFSDKNAGANKTVNVNSSLSGTDAGNYTVTPDGPTTANITRKEVFASINANSKVYDGTTNVGVSGNLPNSNFVSGDNVYWNYLGSAFADKNVGTNKSVISSFSFGGLDGGNYFVGNLANQYIFNSTASITPKTLTNTGITASNKVYDGNTTATATSKALNGVIAGDNLTTSVAANFSDKNAADGKTVTGVTTLSGNDAGNYKLNNVNSTTTANITKKIISNNGIIASNKTYDGTTAATATGAGLTDLVANDDVSITVTNVNFSDKNAGVGKTVTATTNLTGTDAGNYAFNSATSTTTANIDKKAVIASLSTVSKTYDGTDTANSTATSTDFVANDAVSLVASNAKYDDKNAGIGKNVTASVSLSGNDANNYSVTTAVAGTGDITKKAISGDIIAANKTYDGTTATTVTGSTSGKIVGDDLTVNASNGNFIDKNAGSGKVVTADVALSGNDASNYSLTSNTASTTGDIAKKVIANNGITASSKTYDGTTAAQVTGAGLTDLVANDDVSITVTNANFSDRNAGIGKTVTATTNLTGADAGNYAFNSATSTTTANIDKKTVSVSGTTAANKTYDATTVATATAGTVNGLVGTDDVNASITDAQFVDKNAGVGKTVNITTTLGGTDVGNYQIDTASSTVTANIDKKVITNNGITASGKTYDGTTQANATSNTLNDIINGDFVSTSVAAQFGDKNAGNGKTVTGVTTLTGADAGNYAFNNDTSTATADIAKKVITNNGITASNKTYDGTTAAQVMGAGLTDLVATDDVQISISNANFSDKNAGVGKTVTATTNLTGTDANNYVFNSATSTTTANIDKRVISATGTTVDNKTYDGTTAAQVNGTKLVNTVQNDDIKVGATGQFDNKNAGVQKDVNIAYALTGSDANNYTLDNTSAQAKADVAKKTLTYTVDANGQKTYFLGETQMPIGFNPTIDNKVAGDDVNVQGLTFVSNGQAVVPSNTGGFTVGITIGGKDAGNYVVDYSNSSANTPVEVVAKPGAPVVVTPTNPSNVTVQRTAAVSDFVQQMNYVPVYANGRGIDSKAKVTAVTPEDNEADTLKGNRASAVGTRGEPEVQSNLMFKDPAKIKDVDDEMKK